MTYNIIIQCSVEVSPQVMGALLLEISYPVVGLARVMTLETVRHVRN
jgi:hypothetical protein